jgi:hypothetical protein
MVVDHLSAVFRNNKDIGVACIYLNHKEADNQTPSRLLAAVWRQLLLNRDISSDTKELYQQHHQKGTAPSLEEVANVLSSSLKEFSKVFIIVDAIDEYPELQWEILLQHLAAIGSNMNLMVTSRPHVPADPSLLSVETLEIEATPEDIHTYVEAQINLPRLRKHVQNQPKLQEDIHSKINTQTVNGM